LFSLAAVILFASSTDASAQRRGGPVRVRSVVVVGPYYPSPYWYYDPWFYDAQWGVYPPYRYGGYRLDPGAAIRIEVKPKQAEVYVDGYYAGIVDDFDGTFQRLRIEPGEH
jgi:hypothetical protein